MHRVSCIKSRKDTVRHTHRFHDSRTVNKRPFRANIFFSKLETEACNLAHGHILTLAWVTYNFFLDDFYNKDKLEQLTLVNR